MIHNEICPKLSNFAGQKKQKCVFEHNHNVDEWQSFSIFRVCSIISLDFDENNRIQSRNFKF